MRKGKGRGRSKKKKETTIELPLLQKTENERTSDTNSAQATSNAETSLMPYSGAQARDEPDANAIINYTKGDTHSIDPNGQQNFFHNHQNQGRMVGGPVHGTVNQGDHHYNLHCLRCSWKMCGIVFSGLIITCIISLLVWYFVRNSSMFISSSTEQDVHNEKTELAYNTQSNKKDLQKYLNSAKQSLKESYLTRYKTINPLSLPFTFDIENTWVSLAIKEEKNDLQATEDHAELLKNAFDKAKMLIIEGNPATGKTSLMRRLAYEWAKGKQELRNYTLVLYIEFRDVREKTFQSIADMVLGGLEKYLDKRDIEMLGLLLNDKQFCQHKQILLLLDGHDESFLLKQCSELSSYLTENTINKQLFFNIVITTRKGPLSDLKGRKGRFTFAEVLGFTTPKQKEKYITNHFLSSVESGEKEKGAVLRLLQRNGNLNKLAETPLFLTFICLVHEKTNDGSLVELYSNIVWWLINRHQQSFPDRDLPALFEFKNNTNDKFEIIQVFYLHFPQLRYLGKMALHNLEKDIFKGGDLQQFNLQPIIEQVGLLRKEKEYGNSWQLETSFFFPHRTIQEFLAALYCFCSNDPTNEWFLPNSWLDTSYGMNEFERFLLRIALFNEKQMNTNTQVKMQIKPEKRKYYFERIANITLIGLDITFDAFHTTAVNSNTLFNWFLSQCKNVQDISLYGIGNSTRHESSMMSNTSIHDLVITSKISRPTLFTFRDMIKLHSLTFGDLLSRVSGCTFSANSQLLFTNCPSLKKLEFRYCEMESSTHLGIATLPAIDTLQFYKCNIDLATWQSITDQISNSSIKYLQQTFGKDLYGNGADFNQEFLIHLQQCNNVERMDIIILGYTIRQNDLLSFSDLIKLHSLTFWNCTFSANSQLAFTNCPSLKRLKFRDCEMESSTNLGVSTLPDIDTVQFDRCRIDLATWQSITDQINNSSIKYLELTFGKDLFGNGTDFNKEFLIHLQQYNNVEQMEITILGYTIRQNDLLSFSDLIMLHSLTFQNCIFSASSQLAFTNCPSLKNLKFRECEMKSSTIFGIATLPAIDIVQFSRCNIDLATWQSITDQFNNSNVKSLLLSADFFVKETYLEFLHYLQKCARIQQIHVNDVIGEYPNYILTSKEESVTANLALIAQKLPALTSITFSNSAGRWLHESSRLSERNRERIEKAGQERNPDFKIKYAE